MKDLFAGGIALLVALLLVVGLFVLCGWAVSVGLNVVFTQIGLGTINIWAGCCIVATVQIIKRFVCWGDN